VCALGAAGTLAWWLIGRDANVPGAAEKSPPEKTGFRLAPGRSATTVRAEEHPLPASAGPAPADIRSRFNESNDYLAFAASVHEAAQQGDGAAQYYLHRALNYCESTYGYFFIVHLPRGEVRHRTLEEAQQLTANNPLFTLDDVRDMQGRCEKLMSVTPPPYGTSQEWLDAGAWSNYPLSIVTIAARKSIETLQSSSAEERRVGGSRIRQIVIQALGSKDPEVIVRVGDVAANLAGKDRRAAAKQQWIWAMAACGGDEACPALKESIQYLCRADPQCQPFETPVDIIRRHSGNDFDEIERRARELRDKIDAGTIEESDI
jgi:hypothetical protein